MLTKHLFCAFLMIFLTAVLFSACAPAAEPTPTPEILADCFQSATALAWLDENGDGRRNEDEPPLAGIEFVLEPTGYSRTTSDENGVADIFATTPGGNCSESLQIITTRYDGYVLTTPGMVDNIDPDQEYVFGFQPESGTDLPTDSPSDLFVVGENGLNLSLEWDVTAVNYLFTWYGDGWPAYEFEQMKLVDGYFQHANGNDVTFQIESFLVNLTGLTPVDGIQRVNLWTDDYPQWYVEVVGKDGRSLLVYSESTGFRGHAPWYVQVDGQLYRQASGDIGFALYSLVSKDAQEYFTLDEPTFDEEQMEPGARPAIFRSQKNFSGLLPLAVNLAYHIDPTSGSLRGSFAFDNDEQGDTSTHHITGAAQMQLTLPDGQHLPCSLTPEEESEYLTTWYFDCPLPANKLPLSVGVDVQLNTATEQPLTTVGRINLSEADVGE